jgi:hypothetical protein
MRPLMGSLLIVSVGLACTDAADRKDQLFASWQEAQRDLKSLVVQFTLETNDPIHNERHKADGTFRLIRTPKGEVFASYDFPGSKAKDGKQEQCSGLLCHGAVYLLNHDHNTAIRFQLAEGDLMEFLERCFNPFVLLLDRKRAEEKCRLEVVKQDQRYTYLAVKRKQVKRYGWFPDTFSEGRAVLMDKSSDSIPKDMPVQLWYTDDTGQYTFWIKAWRMNGLDAPKAEEFLSPADRPGWEVQDWPLSGKK